MNRICNYLTAASIGAGLSYFFDPVAGNRRRALARDQINHLCNKAGDAADATWRDLQNRAYGVFAELTGVFRADMADDDVLVERVRSKMGRYVSHPAAIEVSAQSGTICLSGPILTHEVDDLFCAVRSVRGVRDIEDHLDVHSSADISALQGGVPRTGEPFEFMQENWSPTARLLAGMAGATLMSKCLARRSPGSLLLGTAGAVLALRALANQDTSRMLRSGEAAVENIAQGVRRTSGTNQPERKRGTGGKHNGSAAASSTKKQATAGNQPEG
jgi:hypothetical protein